MASIFGLINLNDSDYAYVNTAGQALVFTGTLRYLTQYNADMAAAQRVFLDGDTENYKERYKLIGGGRLQRRGGQTVSGAVKATGQWDVAYPLEDFGAQVTATDVAMAYMTPAEYQRHIDTVLVQDTNTMRHEVLRALFNNGARTFVDERWGSLTVQPLANGDSVTYPPALGSENDATDDHYLVSGYAAADVSATNNPIPTLVEELEEHFGEVAGNSNVVVFINPAQAAKLQALAGFDAIEDRYIRSGANTDVPTGLPGVPGKVIGRAHGAWISQWRWVPANYLMGIHLDAPPPLKMRVDPAGTGLGRGLQLVARDQQYPLESAHFRHRFGVGVSNRLNGVVMQLKASGTYDVPTAFA